MVYLSNKVYEKSYKFLYLNCIQLKNCIYYLYLCRVFEALVEFVEIYRAIVVLLQEILLKNPHRQFHHATQTLSIHRV